ncbi:hypothetical protein MMC28_011326 [Mycoblastus sanguinarius]|nr:hypothetical protein [Mycoblastus sanguinarius]
MDLTPIKVRGKKSFAKSESSKHSVNCPLKPHPMGKRPPSPAVSLSTHPAKTPRQNKFTAVGGALSFGTSHLEQLPTEILENIFFQCLNIRLPQASPFLGHKLASLHVKTQLVLRICSSGGSTDYPCELASVFPTLKDQAKAQSAILRQKWMTLSFVRQLIPDYIAKTIVRELGVRKLSWLGVGPPVTSASESLIRRYLNDNAFRFDNILHGRLPAYWEISWEAKNPQRTIVIGIGLRDGLVTLHKCHPGTPVREPPWEEVDYSLAPSDSWYKWMILSCISGCRIPEKLLHGPWTEEKCEFLEIVTRGNATVDWIRTTSGEIAEQGFLDALRERNVRATRALLGQVGQAIPPDVDTETTASWYDKNRSYTVSYPEHLRSCYHLHHGKGAGIVPRAEHLRIAVTEGEYYQDLVKTLLETPGWTTELNSDTNDVYKWAIEKSSAGDSRGIWLLQVLR